MNTQNNTPWIKNSASALNEQNITNEIVLNNFDLVPNDGNITFKLFGSEGANVLVISPKDEGQVTNHIVAHITNGKVTEPTILDIFRKIDKLCVDFVESEGVYYQTEPF